MTIFDVRIGARTGGATESDSYRGTVALVVTVATRSEPGTQPDGAGLVTTIEKLLPH